MGVKIDANAVAQLQQAMKLVQLGTGLVRSIAAAVRAGGGDIPADDVLIARLSDNSAAGEAEADQVIANLQAQLPQ